MKSGPIALKFGMGWCNIATEEPVTFQIDINLLITKYVSRACLSRSACNLDKFV